MVMRAMRRASFPEVGHLPGHGAGVAPEIAQLLQAGLHRIPPGAATASACSAAESTASASVGRQPETCLISSAVRRVWLSAADWVPSTWDW